MDGGGTPRTPEDVFRDFRARRAGMIKALTTGTCRGSSFHSRPCGGVFERFGGVPEAPEPSIGWVLGG